MKTFAHHGYDDFVLCLGYKGDMIKNCFIVVVVDLDIAATQVYDNHDETTLSPEISSSP